MTNDMKIRVNQVKMQFLCCTALNKFKWPDLKNLNADQQLEIINSTVNNQLVIKYPIKQSYIQAFLKEFISKLEGTGNDDIDDHIYYLYINSTFSNTTITNPSEQSSMHFRHFIIDGTNLKGCISLKESTNIISEGTTGLCSWKAAFSLAEWCTENKELIKGKNILELGSGVGLTGLTTVQYCSPKSYYFSDCHPTVLNTLQENIKLNLLNNKENLSWKEIMSNDKTEIELVHRDDNVKVNVLNLKWEDIDKLNLDRMKIDVVLAADVLYDKSTFDSLANSIHILLNETANYAIIAATVRNESTILEFLNILANYDLHYKEETKEVPQIFVQFEDTPIRIFIISRKK